MKTTPAENQATFAELAQVHHLAVQFARSFPDEARELIRLAAAQDALTMEIVEQPGGERRMVAGYSLEDEDGGLTSGELCSFACPAAVSEGLRMETFRRSLIRDCQTHGVYL